MNFLDRFEDIVTENDYKYGSRKVISFSQLSTFKQCPHKWKLRYIDKIKDNSKNIHLIFGTALHETLQIYLYTLYNKSIKKANNIDFDSLLFERIKNQVDSTPKENLDLNKGELISYYKSGLEALRYIVSNRTKLFPKKNVKLVGVEIPLVEKNIYNKNVDFIQFLDLVLYDSKNDLYLIVDIKTSKSGWNEYNKKDIIKRSQVLLYKYYYSKLKEIDIKKIKVKYFIVRHETKEIQKENFVFTTKYVQEYEPPSGNISMNIINNEVKSFIDYCFTDEGEYRTEQKYVANESKLCDYCFYNNEQLCPTQNRVN